MANSYNGWSGISSGTSSMLTTFTVPGTSVKLRVRAGDVATVLKYVATRFHKEVEPLTEGKDDWGWAYRSVRGSTSLSNHASGTAIDLNAMQHPFRTRATQNFTSRQISAIKRIVADCSPVIRWLSEHDPMHFEINYMARGGTPANVAALAKKIRSGALVTAGGGTPSPSPAAGKRTPRAIDWEADRGDLVRIVQQAVGATPDGIRGPATVEATKRKQASLGVPADGLAGPQFVETYLLSVDNLYRAKPDSEMPDAAVKFVQWIGGLTPDGSFGAGTEKAVKEMQTWAGLKADGIVGPATKRAITR